MFKWSKKTVRTGFTINEMKIDNRTFHVTVGDIQLKTFDNGETVEIENTRTNTRLVMDKSDLFGLNLAMDLSGCREDD